MDTEWLVPQTENQVIIDYFIYLFYYFLLSAFRSFIVNFIRVFAS